MITFSGVGRSLRTVLYIYGDVELYNWSTLRLMGAWQ